jgi:hypothetical protein
LACMANVVKVWPCALLQQYMAVIQPISFQMGW